MGKFINQWKNSIFSRMVIIFLLIITPIFILGINMYNWGIYTVSREISNSMSSQISFYINNLEMEIQRIMILQYDCMNDDDLNGLASRSQIMNNFERLQAVLRLQKRLNAIKSSSIYIKDVSVLIPSFGKIVSAQGGLNDISMEEDDMFKTFVFYPTSEVIRWKGRLFLNAVFPLDDLSGKSSPMFMIIIELSEKELEKAIMQFNSYKGSGSVLLSTRWDYFLAVDDDKIRAEQIQELLKNKYVNSKSGTFSTSIASKSYLVTYAASEHLKMTISRYVLEAQIFEPVNRYRVWLWFFSVASIAIIIVFSFLTYIIIHQPLKKLVESFRHFESGDMNIRIEHNHSDEFRYLYSSFNSMVKNLSMLIDQVYRQKILAQHAELKYLQMQINPHFLYNSFFIVYRMAKMEDFEGIIHLSQLLANYFQFITRSKADEVTLEKEVAHTRAYGEIQAIRFSNRIQVDFEELPENYKDFIVPRLIMQPIVENAFEHGLKDKKNNCIIRICFYESDKNFNISVEDNGDRLGEYELENLKNTLYDIQNDGEITGLANVYRRIQLKFGPESGLDISRSEYGGLKIVISIYPKKSITDE